VSGVPAGTASNAVRPGRRQAAAIWLLLLVVLLAAGLRLFHLSHQSFWLDEVSTVNAVRRAVPSLTMSDSTPPLYYMMMSLWMRAVPESEAAARLPSALFGIAAVPLLFLLGRWLFGTRAGLIAALLLAVSPFHIHYSQEARAYSLMLMLVLFSWLALVRMLDRESISRLAAWVAATSLMLLSHNYGVFIIAAQIVFILAWGRSHGIRIRRWIIAIGLVALLAAPWIRVLLILIEQVQHADYWIQQPTVADFVKLYRMMCADSGWLMKINLLLSIAGLFWWRLRFSRPDAPRHGRTAIPLLGTWLFVPLVLMVLASIFLLPLYQHRYALPLLPPFLLLVAWGASGHGHRPAALVLAGVLLCFTVPALVTYYTEDNREPWDRASSVVSDLAREGDVLLFIAPAVREPFIYYYRGPDLPSKVLSRYPKDAPRVELVTMKCIRRHDRLWAVVSHCHTGVLEEILDRRLGQGRLLGRWAFRGITIYCYRADGFQGQDSALEATDPAR